jgi:hypothetical protein
MIVGLMQARVVSLAAWVPYVHRREVYMQSRVRRFDHWLKSHRIEVQLLYDPLIQQALAAWDTHALYLALDTSTLWNTYCVVRISRAYRGYAIPLGWKVL